VGPLCQELVGLINIALPGSPAEADTCIPNPAIAVFQPEIGRGEHGRGEHPIKKTNIFLTIRKIMTLSIKIQQNSGS
jgi:hypothetical protein